MIENLTNKINDFAGRLESDTVARMKLDGHVQSTIDHHAKTTVVPGSKYTKVNIGGSGRYMVENSTGIIYWTKGYGVIHRGYSFGTVDTINDWDWSSYKAIRLAPKFAPPAEIAAKVAKVAKVAKGVAYTPNPDASESAILADLDNAYQPKSVAAAPFVPVVATVLPPVASAPSPVPPDFRGHPAPSSFTVVFFSGGTILNRPTAS